MRNIFSVIFMITFFSSHSYAQDEPKAYQFRSVVTEAWRTASDLSSQMEATLLTQVPTIPGWSCKREISTSTFMSGAGAAPPILNLSCEHAEQMLAVTLSLDPSSAKQKCRFIEGTKTGISDGRIKPGLFRFFSTRDWHIMRSSVDLQGCLSGVLAFSAHGRRSQNAIDAGPASIDQFGEAMLTMDIVEILDSEVFAQQQKSLQYFVDGLELQAKYLARAIPLPVDSSPDTVVLVPPVAKLSGKMPLPIILAHSPSAFARFEIQGCQILVEISASEVAIYEAMNTGLRWAKPRGKDGEIVNAYMRRNTDRLVGQERIDGTGIEVFVDNRVIVRVMIPGAIPCESKPNIVTNILREIMVNDFSTFGIK